jgi:exonuclease VII large subunit
MGVCFTPVSGIISKKQKEKSKHIFFRMQSRAQNIECNCFGMETLRCIAKINKVNEVLEQKEKKNKNI